MRRVLVFAIGFFIASTFVSAATCIELTRTLILDSTGPDVSRLQIFLRDNANYTGAVSGHFGPRTRDALGKWQLRKGFVMDRQAEGYGVLDSDTRSAMSCLPRDLSLGTTGADVTRLQRVLISLGFLATDATGYFGPATEAAVKEFQNARGINPTGTAGPTSRSILVWVAPGKVPSSVTGR